MQKRIVYLYYPALMIFLVFTFADTLLRGIIHNYSVELLLYTVLWLFVAIQATFAYDRIRKVKPKNYPTAALLSDCLDIVLIVYICAAISGVYGRNETNELNSYLHLSIPFFLVSINQFSWFVIVRNFDIPAVFRLSILFIGMLAVTISENICHDFINLVAIVSIIVLLGILRAVNWAPGPFNKLATKIWSSVKKGNPKILQFFLEKTKGKTK